MRYFVDGTVNTRTKQRILGGSFFEHKCKCCGETSFIPHSMLYEDPLNNLTVFHTQTILGVADAYRTIDDRDDLNDDDHQVRIVTSANALREKVRIFDKELDDRIIEIMKALILEELCTKKNLGRVDEILCWVRDGDGNFEIDVLAEHIGSMTVKRDFYYYLENKVKHLLDKQYPNPKEVGIDFAIEFLERNHFRTNSI